jgi:hypothetical protein
MRTLDADVEGALQIGLDAIFFNESKLQVEDHIKQVSHLLELKNIYNYEEATIIHRLIYFRFGNRSICK